MTTSLLRADILQTANVFREFAQVPFDREWLLRKPAPDLGENARAYFEAARRLARNSRRDEPMETAFRPFFLINGLLQAANFKRRADRVFTLEVLADGLTEFSDYFEAIHPDRLAPEETPEEFARLSAQQTRYLAYCAAQLPECGMDMEGVWMTMKGDSLDMETSAQLRAILEEGPDKIAAASFFSVEEKRLWAEAYAQRPGAYEELQALLVRTHHLPLRKPPPA